MLVRRKRNKRGQFLKRRAKSHTRRRAKAKRRRNPHVILANPLRKRRRRTHKRRSNPTGLVISRRQQRRGTKAWRRKPHAKRRYTVARAKHGKARVVRRNPFKLTAWKHYAKLGISGGLGIVTARIAGAMYTKHLSGMVGGGADPKSARGIANDVARLIVMGAIPVLIERSLLRRQRMIDGKAFMLGGLAETGRQAIGVVLKKVKPDLALDSYGLGAYVADGGGNVYQKMGDGRWHHCPHLSGSEHGMGGLTDGEEFAGLTDGEEFAGYQPAGGYARSGQYGTTSALAGDNDDGSDADY